eukprot:352915-Chlamydomonas_euryale.AAC.5
MRPKRHVADKACGQKTFGQNACGPKGMRPERHAVTGGGVCMVGVPEMLNATDAASAWTQTRPHLGTIRIHTFLDPHASTPRVRARAPCSVPCHAGDRLVAARIWRDGCALRRRRRVLGRVGGGPSAARRQLGGAAQGAVMCRDVQAGAMVQSCRCRSATVTRRHTVGPAWRAAHAAVMCGQGPRRKVVLHTA